MGPRRPLQVEAGKTIPGENLFKRPPVKGEGEACSPERRGDLLKVTGHAGAELRPVTGFQIPSPGLLPVCSSRATQMSAIDNQNNSNNNSDGDS